MKSWKIYLLTLICFFTGTSEFVIVGILDEISTSANITIAQAGQLTTVFAITSALGTPLAIYYLKELNQRKVLIVALALVLTGCISLSIAANYVLMILSRIVMALGVGVFNVLCFIVATKLVSPERKAAAIATVTIGYNAALIIGLPIGRLVAGWFGWKAIFWYMAVFCFASIFAVYKFIPAFAGEEPAPLKNQLKLLHNNRLLLSLSVSFFWILGYATLYSFITPFLQQVSAMPGSMLSFSLLAFGIATLMGNRLGAFLGEKYGIPQTILFAMLLNVTSLILLSFSRDMPYVSIFVLMIWALAAWAPGPLLRFNVISLTSDSPGVILSFYNSLIQFGVAIGAGLAGIEIHHLSVVSLSYTAAVMVAISAGLAYLFSYGTHGVIEKQRA